LVALLALALLCWVNLLAVSPHLHHEACGNESNSSQHHCAATLFSKSQITPAAPVMAVFAASLISLSALELPAPIWASADHAFSPGRAPPSRLA
jgi:hypothetical protein